MRFFVLLRPWQPGRETRIAIDACPDAVVNQCAINENCKKTLGKVFLSTF